MMLIIYGKVVFVEIAIIYKDEFVTQNIIKSDDSVKTVDLKELIRIINRIAKIKGSDNNG